MLARRRFNVAMALALAGAAPISHAETVIDKPAKIVVGFPPGGAADSIARLLAEQLRDMLQAIGGLERIRRQPFPASLTLMTRMVVWLFAWLMFLRLEADALTPALGNAVAFVLMASYVSAERLLSGLDHPLEDPVLGLPLHHICARISGDLLGDAHPLARPPQPESATIWT